MSSLDVYHMLPPFGFIVQLHLNQKKPFVKDFMVMLIIRNPRIVGAPIRGQGMAYSAISYPNTWGYIAFQAMLMIWYLYAREKQLFTFAMFWCMAGFMFFCDRLQNRSFTGDAEDRGNDKHTYFTK